MSSNPPEITEAEIERILNMPPDQYPVEEAMAPEDSPLNDPVEEKEFPDPPQEDPNPAPIPDAMLQLAAGSILNTVDTLIGLGAGYFVKIKRHKEFCEIEEVIQVIDAQNEKNVKALQLDAEDKAMLTPILVQVLRKRGKAPTPEQQLLMITLTILMKKAQLFLQIRSENQEMTERLLEAIRQTKEETTAPQAHTHTHTEENTGPFVPQEQVQAVPEPQAQTEPISAPKLEVPAPSLATQDQAAEKLPEAPQEPQLPLAVEKTITNTETTEPESDSPETPQIPTQNPNWKAQKKRLKKRKKLQDKAQNNTSETDEAGKEDDLT